MSDDERKKKWFFCLCASCDSIELNPLAVCTLANQRIAMKSIWVSLAIKIFVFASFSEDKRQWRRSDNQIFTRVAWCASSHIHCKWNEQRKRQENCSFIFQHRRRCSLERARKKKEFIEKRSWINIELKLIVSVRMKFSSLFGHFGLAFSHFRSPSSLRCASPTLLRRLWLLLTILLAPSVAFYRNQSEHS